MMEIRQYLGGLPQFFLGKIPDHKTEWNIVQVFLVTAPPWLLVLFPQLSHPHPWCHT